MNLDPVETNPTLYTVVFENDFVRVLEYHDTPATRSEPHHHPDSVMVTLSSFHRRLSTGGCSIDVELPSGAARWLPAQEHFGENIGATDTHALFVELKHPRPSGSASSDAWSSDPRSMDAPARAPLGPD
ncbi:cytoplasmic protein [Marisediminicola senii]|uniref:cytoplasmic protein n=1 Tax=Marisediminicola senii TaxID=2711233 RepID=UPI0013ED48D1|nr:cytoplasmic protein [Marisediminicola senii]